MRKPFCVIGPTSINRTWMSSVDEAVEHAKQLMQGNPGTKELFVVEVKRIVRKPLPAVEVVHAADYDEMPVLSAR